MVTGEYPPRLGGVGAYTARLCEALGPDAVQVAVLTGGRAPGWEVDASATRGIPVARAVPRWTVAAFPGVQRAATAWGAELVHLQYQAAAFDLSGVVPLLPAWLRLRLPRVRVAVTFHDLRPPYLFPKAGPLRPASLRLMASASHGVACTEPADLRMLGERRGRRAIPLASNIDCRPPPGYAQAAWRRARGLPADAPLVGFFGFVGATKGVDTLLRALAALPEARLALIGGEAGASDPSDRAGAAHTRALERALGLEGRVWRSGALEPAEVSAALLACDAVALPFVDGASGRRGTLLAALAHGRAVITTQGPDDALLTPGQHALLVPPGDAAALAGAIRAVLDDPTLRGRLEAGAARLAARHTWPSIARAHQDWYRELLRSRGL
jgi:glycosyltransferase involved in cell wall biosynthesis